MRTIKRILFIAFALLLPGLVNAQVPKPGKGGKPFTAYAFIVYAGYVQYGNEVKANYKQLRQYLLGYGIKEMDLIYEQKMLDYPAGDMKKENGVPNVRRIDSLAKEAMHFDGQPVSFDLEGWKRFDTVKTPDRMLEVISEFKKVNQKSKVGLYATVPQNTYVYSPTISRYDKVNKAYAKVAAAVDYFSPSFYNYSGHDTVEWNKAIRYNMQACKKYGYPDKPILPYLTPEVTEKGVTTMLTYDEMMGHLKTIYSLGASGCLIWTSSSTKDEYGRRIYIDVNSGWLKAVRDFMAGNYN
jgi:hypothetical protein